MGSAPATAPLTPLQPHQHHQHQQLLSVPHQHMQQTIHRCIGALLWQDRDRPHLIGRGTAVLISPNLILTCAHSIYRRKEGRTHFEFRFYPAQCGPLTTPYKITNYCFPEPYKHSGKHTSIQYDYALMLLQSSVPYHDFLPLSGSFSDLHATLAIYGYPASKYTQEGKEESVESVQQWGLTKSECVRSVEAERCELAYELQTVSGQSGAPIVQIMGARMSVVGVHKGVHRKSGLSFGCLLNSATIDLLRQQCRRLGGLPFVSYEQQEKIEFYRMQLEDGPSSHNYVQLARLLQQHRPEEADRCYGRAIELDPLSAEASHLRANLQYQRQNYVSCVRIYKRGLMVNPCDAAAYCNLATAYKQLKMENLLQVCYRSALKLDPNNNAILNNYARYLISKGQSSQAITHLRTAINLNPHFYHAWLNLGNLYYHLQQYANAVECYKRAAEVDPNEDVVQYNMGVSYEKLMDRGELGSDQLRQLGRNAVSCLSRAIQLNPGDPAYRVALARCSAKSVKQSDLWLQSIKLQVA